MASIPNVSSPPLDAAQSAEELNPFLELPPEIRNMIYIDYLALYPELILLDHENSSTVVPRAPLIRVNKQIRSEITPMLRFYATHLVMRAKDDEIHKLVNTTKRFDKQTLAAMHPSNKQPTDKPTQNQLIALQRADTLRSRKSPTLAASLRQFPALRVLVLELSTTRASSWDAVRAVTDTWMRRLENINNVHYRRFTALNLKVQWTKKCRLVNVGAIIGHLVNQAKRWNGRWRQQDWRRVATLLGANTEWADDDDGAIRMWDAARNEEIARRI